MEGAAWMIRFQSKTLSKCCTLPIQNASKSVYMLQYTQLRALFFKKCMTNIFSVYFFQTGPQYHWIKKCSPLLPCLIRRRFHKWWTASLSNRLLVPFILLRINWQGWLHAASEWASASHISCLVYTASCSPSRQIHKPNHTLQPTCNMNKITRYEILHFFISKSTTSAGSKRSHQHCTITHCAWLLFLCQ